LAYTKELPPHPKLIGAVEEASSEATCAVMGDSSSNLYFVRASLVDLEACNFVIMRTSLAQT
jgi:hypothetical protein